MFKTKLPGRILIVTSDYPPAPGGSSVVFMNLLANVDPSSFVVLTKLWNSRPGIHEPEGYTVYRVPPLTTFARGQRYWEPLMRHFVVSSIVMMGLKAVRETGCTGVFAAFPHLPFLEAGYLIAKKAGLHFSVYLHDALLESAADQLLYKKWAKRVQRRVFSEAVPIFVMSDGLKQFYKTRYRLDTVTLRHCFNEPLPQGRDIESTTNEKTINLFFGGSIYRMCFNALKNIIDAVNPEPDIHVTISNPYPLHSDISLPDNRLHHCFLPDKSEFLKKIRLSDILIVPLGFTNQVHHGEISTVFPTKCIEYFWAGKPILVHCPKDYFLARFFQEHECGMVVSDPDPQTIRDAIRALKNNRELRTKFINGARESLRLFDGKQVAETFVNSLLTNWRINLND